LAKFLAQEQKDASFFAATHDLVQKQRDSLRRQKRLAATRGGSP
jgi:hypothetical protein